VVVVARTGDGAFFRSCFGELLDDFRLWPRWREELPDVVDEETSIVERADEEEERLMCDKNLRVGEATFGK
jgi:hypothetical protein